MLILLSTLRLALKALITKLLLLLLELLVLKSLNS
jgi:hypothetical protein